MISFLTTILHCIFKAMERSSKARARRFLNLHKGTWQ
jgi:hypothetical protein